MTKLYVENWLSIIAGIYLISMVLYGHRKGFIRLSVSMFAVILSLSIAKGALPTVTTFLKENTKLQQTISETMKESIGMDGDQQSIMEGLDLPQSIKEGLMENNNSDMYQLLGVDRFTDYIGTYIANKILHSVGFVIIFSTVYIGLKMVIRWLDIVARLPVLSGINKLAGALLGGLQGLVFIWIFCIVITVFSGTGWGAVLFSQMEKSRWLFYVYNHNFLNLMILGVFRG